MEFNKIPERLFECPYTGVCGARTERGECGILNDVNFKDGSCHFQKEEFDTDVKVLTEQDVIDRFNAGMTMVELCAEANVGMTAIARVLDKGKRDGRVIARYHKFTDDDKDEIIGLYKSGMSKREISRRKGINYSRVIDTLKGVTT